MKYLQNKPFSIGPSDSAEANKRYADNWDAIFGKKPPEGTTDVEALLSAPHLTAEPGVRQMTRSVYRAALDIGGNPGKAEPGSRLVYAETWERQLERARKEAPDAVDECKEGWINAASRSLFRRLAAQLGHSAPEFPGKTEDPEC